MEPQTVSESIRSENLDATWKLVSIPAWEVENETSHWHHKEVNGTAYTIGKYNGAYEVIISPSLLQELEHQRFQINLEYDPTKPGGRQKDVYGIERATSEARALWLCHAAHKIRSGRHPEVPPAYRRFAQLNGLQEALAREILLTSTVFPEMTVSPSSAADSRIDDYTLILVSNVEDQSLETLEKAIGAVFEVANIVRLNDRSWEICIVKSYRLTAQRKINEINPDSDIDLQYNPLEPTTQEVTIWGEDKAKKLCRLCLFERSIKIIGEGRAVAGTYYTNLLRAMCGLDEAVASLQSDR